MKTPEELAEEYIRYDNESAYWTKHAFLAGYQAAKDQLANAGKAMPQWISVKDRLPEDKESVIYWHDLHGTNIGHYDSTFPKPNYHWWSYNYGDHADFRVHWWMPLPKIPEAPKEEYQFTGRDVPIFEKPKGE
jgi:hypothetical protein